MEERKSKFPAPFGMDGDQKKKKRGWLQGKGRERESQGNLTGHASLSLTPDGNNGYKILISLADNNDSVFGGYVSGLW